MAHRVNNVQQAPYKVRLCYININKLMICMNSPKTNVVYVGIEGMCLQKAAYFEMRTFFNINFTLTAEWPSKSG